MFSVENCPRSVSGGTVALRLTNCLMKRSVFMRNYYTAPSLVDISITNRCNLKCDYCYASSSPFETKK